ncbi:hypothetical protein SAMN06297144_0371 [Sphingomonas guangdongensis]|uniref:Uncharacterized protein n=1 Tax=Sphingomonas guangdongensis TaxID=1141890 RepID=A0A285QB29_9SPHN|nr:hypothetical protein [Sphingomonas guangdongensis]SOB79093.1 hypothetical protein SAMN06297144_0371 [Sphingomonas guangdongensis]
MRRTRSPPGETRRAGKLTLDGCARIESLPPTVRELFGLSAVGCSLLASIGSLVECHGPLDLRGCDALAPLPADFKAVNCVELDGLWIGATFIALKCQLPDVVREAAIGKRIGDVISHRILDNHRLLDVVISDARESMTWGGVVLDVDTSSMITVNKNK